MQRIKTNKLALPFTATGVLLTALSSLLFAVVLTIAQPQLVGAQDTEEACIAAGGTWILDENSGFVCVGVPEDFDSRPTCNGAPGVARQSEHQCQWLYSV